MLGKIFVLFGTLIVVVGLILMFVPKIPYLGRLPGDIHIKKEIFELYFPLATSLLLSLVLSGIFWLISSVGKK